MKKAYSYLANEAKQFKGALLGIGIDNDKLINNISNNDNITFCDLLNNNNNDKEKGFGKRKKVSIKKLKKRYKKNRIDYILCDYHVIEPYLKYFVKDSIYINNNLLYLFSTKDKMDIDLIEKRYKRYNTKVEIKEFKDSIIVIINNKKAKNKIFKEKFYFISDTFYNLIELISSFLLN